MKRKRILGLFTAFMLLCSVMVALPVLAAEVTISGTPRPGYTLTADYAGADGTEQYVWQAGSAAAGPFTDIADATESAYTLKNAQGEKFVRVQVTTTDGAVLASDAVSVAKALGPLNVHLPNDSSNWVETTATTPAEVKFRIPGFNGSFILLDVDPASETSRYFVITDEHYARTSFDTEVRPGYARYNPESEYNIGYFLNHVITGEEDAAWDGYKSELKILPEEIVSHIDRNHQWLTEGGLAASNCPDDYVVTCGLAPLSYTEYTQYASKIGYNLATGQWLRTSRGLGVTATDLIMRVMTSAQAAQVDPQGRMGGLINQWNSNEAGGQLARPAFWLDKDFFTSVKLDMATLGSDVKAAMVQNYAVSELAGLYTQEELEQIGFVDLPEAANAGVVGGAAVGETVMGTYTYAAPNGVAEGSSSYRWLVADTADGTYQPVAGQTARELEVPASMEGKYLRFEVTPRNANGLSGYSVASAPMGPIREAQDFAAVFGQVTDEMGDPFEGFGSATSLTVHLDIQNRSGAEATLAVMVCFYDAEGMLTGCSYLPATVPAAGGDCEATATIPAGTASMRTVLVDSEAGMRPLSVLQEVR